MSLKNVHKRYGNRSIYEGLDFHGAPQGALVRHGRQRRRQIHAAEAGGGLDASRTTARSLSAAA